MAQALLRFLQAQYSSAYGSTQRFIPAVAGIFGHGNVSGLGEGLLEPWSDFAFIQGHNEQSMVHMAAAFARESRRRATIAVASSIGPGATNMVTGAASATINRVPVLLLPGDIYARRFPDPVLQQLEFTGAGDVSVNDAFRPVSKFFDRIQRPEQLLTALPEAMRILTDPAETGAVTIALPQDVQSEAYDYPSSFFAQRVWEIERVRPDPDRLGICIQLLRGASNPLIVAGGGIWYADAAEELERLSALLQIPVAETFAGKGALQVESWRSLGGIGVEGTRPANDAAMEADVVLCIGTRLADFVTGSHSLFKNPDVRFVTVNVNGHDLHKQGALAIRGDAKLTLALLADMTDVAKASARVSHLRRAQIEEAKRRWWQEVNESLSGDQLTGGSVIRVLNDQAQDGDMIVTAAGAPPGELHKLWDATAGKRCHIEFGYSCMGYELPAGLGSWLARPDLGRVTVLIGDGSFLINAGELVTLVQERAPITIVILDNDGYQVIRRLQEKKTGATFGNEFRRRKEPLNLHADDRDGQPWADGDYVATDLESTARALGAHATTARTETALAAAVDEANRINGPAVIVVPIAHQTWLPDAGCWWDVAPAEASERPEIIERRLEYDRDTARERRYYSAVTPRAAVEQLPETNG
jgi:3D-(3,5/4)-trihydroxycyclohexane-1,2-dione acylhydrolase (decyclizing)